METWVASLTDHRSVADWPFSIVPGSAENWMEGFAGGGAGCVGAGGGGGGGGGTFFLQPANKTIMNNDNSNKLRVRLLILNFAS